MGLGTFLLLLVPLIAMQITAEVHWTASDFLAMGTLIMLAGSLFVILARKLAPRYLAPVAIVIVVGFLYVWAELAVGVFS